MAPVRWTCTSVVRGHIAEGQKATLAARLFLQITSRVDCDCQDGLELDPKPRNCATSKHSDRDLTDTPSYQSPADVRPVYAVVPEAEPLLALLALTLQAALLSPVNPPRGSVQTATSFAATPKSYASASCMS